jgi:hypothetical protein
MMYTVCGVRLDGRLLMVGLNDDQVRAVRQEADKQGWEQDERAVANARRR